MILIPPAGPQFVFKALRGSTQLERNHKPEQMARANGKKFGLPARGFAGLAVPRAANLQSNRLSGDD